MKTPNLDELMTQATQGKLKAESTDDDKHCISGILMMTGYSPSASLLQAVELWQKHCSSQWHMQIAKSSRASGQRYYMYVVRDGQVGAHIFRFSDKTPDLPRAITAAWVEAMEGSGPVCFSVWGSAAESSAQFG